MADRVEGFVILGPGFPLEAGCYTFGVTMSEAWNRHIGYKERPIGDLATLKGRWAARGWRPVPVTLELRPTPTEQQTDGGEER